jgi:hypothetical protein
MRLLALTSMVLVAGCTEAVPCSTCPPVDGVYSVSWADGGTAEMRADGGSCSAPSPRPASWTLTQRGANVTTVIESINLGGTLYDTYDLALTGTSSGISYRVRALVIPEGTSVDGGIRLQGTFTTRVLPENGDTCEVSDTFTAQRVSR